MHTLLNSAGQPQLRCVVTIEEETHRIVTIHRLNDGQGLATKPRLGKFCEECRSPDAIIGLKFVIL